MSNCEKQKCWYLGIFLKSINKDFDLNFENIIIIFIWNKGLKVAISSIFTNTKKSICIWNSAANFNKKFMEKELLSY